MHRRRYLATGAAVLAGLAGCSGQEDDVQDSDGDGVVDSEDYAPQDPDVQSKSDLPATATLTPAPTATPEATATTAATTPTATAAPTATPTPAETPTPTETVTPTPTAGPTPTPSDDDALVVTDDYWQNTSHITAYSDGHVTVELVPGEPESPHESEKLWVGLAEYPRSSVIEEGLSDRLSRDDGQETRTVALSPDLTSGTTYHYLTAIVPGSVSSPADLNDDDFTTVMETDPFVRQGDGLARTQYDGQLADDSGDNYARNSVEGAYKLDLQGRTGGREWAVDFFGFKSAHAEAIGRDRGRSRPEYVNYELTEGSATELANLLKDEATSRDYSESQAVEFAIDFTQSLPYVPDDVSKGFDDYTKFIMETMPEMGGDCEDTAILLASVLQADTFGYDAILIQPPGHMAVGIYQEEPAGYYWELDGRKYSYIETTGQGWAIGDCPEEYQGADAYLHQV